MLTQRHAFVQTGIDAVPVVTEVDKAVGLPKIVLLGDISAVPAHQGTP